jgi:Asp/Glu/hydantoin racemase
MAEVDQQHREELSEVRRQHREDLTEVSALFETQTATLHETIAGLKRDLHVAQRLAAAEQLEGMEDDELDAMEALVREERRRQLHVRNSAEIAAFSPPPYCAE